VGMRTAFEARLRAGSLKKVAVSRKYTTRLLA